MHIHYPSLRSLLAAVPAAALLACTADSPTPGGIIAETVSSAVLTSAVTDPVGDAVASQGEGLTGAAYQDIVGSGIDQTGGVFNLSMDVAAPIPANPVMPPGIKLQEWSWNLNTGPGLPGGFPFAPGNAAPPEFVVHVLWDGTTFTGTVIDRRPLLTGGEARTTAVSFVINGSRVSASVNAAILGNPSSFTWIARTDDWPTLLGTNSVQTLDRAPDISPASLPQ